MQKPWPINQNQKNFCHFRRQAKGGASRTLKRWLNNCRSKLLLSHRFNVREAPPKAFVFDILYKDGVSLLEKPLVERMNILEETLPSDDILMRTRNHLVGDARTLSLLFEEAISKGLEGV